MSDKKSIKEINIESRLLFNRLRDAQTGDVITYSELSEIIGIDVQNGGRGYLNTARKMCEREKDKAFGTIVNHGLKCLNDSEVVETAVYAVGHIKRTSRKYIRKLRCVNNFDMLTNDDKIKFNTYASTLGVLSNMTKISNIKKIEVKVQETQERLPYVKALEVFK